MHLSRTPDRRCVAAAAVIAAVVSILIAAPASVAAPKPPPRPSDSQINAAQSQKDSLASQVGALSGQIASAQAELQRLDGEREFAEQKFALAYSQLQMARGAARLARARVTQAAASADAAHTRFIRYVQASYMDGTPSGTTGTLLTASDPNALLDQSALQQYQADNKIDAIGNLQRASVVKSNADAAARTAVQSTTAATKRADAARIDAVNAVITQRAQEATLQTSLASSESALTTAQSTLATLNHQRAAYDAYVAEQRRLAAIARAKAARERARQLAEAEAAAAARERARSRHSSDGGSSSPIFGPSPPSGGSWTAAKGERAVARAMTTLGTPYAWAGGGPWGPSRGFCDPSAGAPNDCNVIGYDCSGLMMYAWGQSWAHFAATQYTQAGSYHPSLNNLMPGDLLFWSNDGTIGSIHHVAIYKGGGEIIQAPNSGQFVEVSGMFSPGSIFGATRPDT